VAGIPQRPTLRDVACQAWRDWFGKDVQETPTVSYVWTADQFGHFGLGFQITFALTWVIGLFGHDGLTWKLGLGATNLVIWLAKESIDYVREKRIARVAQSIFSFNGRELIWNIVTALIYIGAGIVVATASFIGPRAALWACVLLLPLSLAVAVGWLRLKITFQQAGLPYLYRLANFPANLVAAEADLVLALINPVEEPICRHLVLSGPIGAGKSSLAAGIGTEFAFRMGIGRYTTLVKLLQSNETNSPGGISDFQDGRIMWPWQTAPLLVVDDVDDAGDMAAYLIRATRIEEPPIAPVERALSRLLNDAVRCGLASRRTVWVIGDTDPVPWIAMLRRVFAIADDAIAAVTLTESMEEAIRRKRAARTSVGAGIGGVAEG
jgi:hypothetical protein